MMIIKYDLEKDKENFLNSLRSKNNPTPTTLHKEYFAIYGEDIKEEKVEKFLKEKSEETHLTEKGKGITKEWMQVEATFAMRAAKIFGVKIEETIAYLTTNQRCTYNLTERYFFVYGESKSPIRNIMHELLHFYTYDALYKELAQKGVGGKEYNDIKESLTELLNIEFSELMRGFRDEGYPQHQEMRKRIRSLWTESHDVRKVIGALIAK